MVKHLNKILEEAIGIREIGIRAIVGRQREQESHGDTCSTERHGI